MSRSALRLVLLLGWACGSVATAAGPADDLLKLIPADPGVTLAVEDLRGHIREIAGSPLFEGIKALPSVRAWLASDRFRRIERGARDVRTVLGVSSQTLLDDLLGDAVVLALQLGPDGKPDRARGLLLVQPRDRALIPRLLKALDDAQKKSGELIGVESRKRGPVEYKVRLFKPGGRPPEYYIQLETGAFAWSNSEAMIQGVVDRNQTGAPGLGDDPTFRKVRRGLPERSIVSLYVNPRVLERMMANSPGPSTTSEDRPAAMLARYVGAVGQMGFALQWQDGIILHSHEALVPEKLDPWLRRWLTRPASPVGPIRQVPPSAVAILSAHLDLDALRGAAWDLMPDRDRPSTENLKLLLQGILMGHDPLVDVLPRLKPGKLAYIDLEPDRSVPTRFPMVGVVGWSDLPGADDLAAPVDNALRTALAMVALDPKRREAHLRIESRAIGEARVTLLTDGLRTVLAYRVDRDRLVVGNSPEAVARFGTGQPPPSFALIRAKHFPEAETFAIVDLTRLVEEVKALRGPIARGLAARSGRPVDSADQDLGRLIAIAELFRAATFTSSVDREATEIHRMIGLIAR
jgi:hypothetical protein